MQEEFSIGLFLGKLFKKRKMIIGVTALFILISVIFALVLPQKYMAVTSLLPPDDDSGSTLSSLLSQTGMALPFSLLGGGGGAGLIDKEILSSSTIRMKVVDDLNLYELYELEEARAENPAMAREAAILLLGENSVIDYDDVSNVLRLSVMSTDPQRSVDIVEKYLSELESFNQDKIQASGRSKRIFLERRLALTQNDLEDAETAIKEFAAENGTIHIPTELENELALLAELNSRLIFLELERATVAQDAAPNSPVLRRVDTSIRVLRDKLNQMETVGDPDMHVHALNSLPALTLEYFNFQKNLRIQQEIATLLIQQIEQAKLQETNDIPTLKILDSPRVPTLAIWPRKKLIVIAATMLGFILACLMALVSDFADSIKTNKEGKLDAWQWLPGMKRSKQA
ncbi:MAG: hypothetical protein GY835_17330 [bacterium]|nr:hypothetical protein [bacterium]